MRSTNTKSRRGATTVEFALVVPLILTLVFGLMEWGRFEMVRQVTSTAAFNAARVGTIPGATITDVEDRASQILDMYFVNGASTTATFSTTETRVQVSVPMSQNSFVLNTFFGDKTIVREFVLQAD